MSFSANWTMKNKEVLGDELNVVGLTEPQNLLLSTVEDLTPSDEIFLMAFDSVIRIIDSGAMGDPDGEYRINVTGHANPGHEPVEGWANDTVTISITQV